MTRHQIAEFKRMVALLDREGLTTLLERLKEEKAPLGMVLFVATEAGKKS